MLDQKDVVESEVKLAVISTRVQQKALHRVVCCALGEGCLALIRFLDTAAAG